MTLSDYEHIVGKAEVHGLRALGDNIAGKKVTMVNSTAVGGGVAEILNRLVPLLNELSVQTQWRVITGGEDFFEITKGFHNALHGEAFDLRPGMLETFLEYNERNRKDMIFDDDIVVIHDPQPAALIKAREEGSRARWIWRCHIDLSNPDPVIWGFLKQFVEKYDAALFSSPSFSRKLSIAQYLFYPSIDPLTDKNKDLDQNFIAGILERFNIDPGRPIISQISRFDRLKDPIGVLRAFKQAKKYNDCQLVLAGGGAADDPEGSIVLNEVRAEANGDPDIHILELPATSNLEINALQRASTIVIQKSLREGFGLTVTEALWKRKPVIASAVGGIPLQIVNKYTGMLVHSVEGTAYQIRYLLSHPDIAKKLGENGHEHVKQNFLITSNLRRYLLLFSLI